MSIRGIGHRALALVCALMFFTGCGGGGGGTPAATELGRFIAELRGSEETTVVDAGARGAFVARILDDGTLEFAAAAQLDYAGNVIGLHIHRGVAGANGGIEVNLLAGGLAFDAVSGTLSGTLEIDPALAAEIAATPGDFYVNVHTVDAGDGLARGQVAALGTMEWHALMLGSNETVVFDADARGAATFSVQPSGRIDYVIAMQSPPAAEVNAAHIHVGAPGQDGIPVVNLDPVATGTVDAAHGTISGSVAATMPELARILVEPEAFYCNVHTLAASPGAARGQLGTAPVEFWAALRGDEESVVVDADARGGMTLVLDSFTAGRAIFALPAAQPQGIGQLVAAHVHEGGTGVAGVPVIDLTGGADFGTSFVSGSAEGSVACTQALFARLLAEPAAFYCNIHTVAAGDGLVRGQLTQTPAIFFSDLKGANEVPVADGDATGAATVVMTGAHACEFTILMSEPAPTEITGAQIHFGTAGVNGSALASLLNGSDFQVDPSGITGGAALPGHTFARMLASDAEFYVSVKSAAAPDGLARGQCTRVLGTVPPAGLTYDSPVTYFTEVRIANNIPQSLGGAITNYTIAPALPGGLFLNVVTGILSGTPHEARPLTTYTITGSNNVASTTASLAMEVRLSPPASLTYPSSLTFATGSAINPAISPTQTGGVITSYSVSPDFPAGIDLDAGTGVISGTPSEVAATASYEITGSNAAGSVTRTIELTVTQGLQAPSNLSYSESSPTYTVGVQITNNTPTIEGGAVASWSISPALPSGLAFSTSTGVISGTPNATQNQTDHTVTATNAAGSTTAKVTITVNPGAPIISYNPNFGLGYTAGSSTPLAISLTPTNTGGASTNWSISPALPSGVTINSSTGAISGTPTATHAQTTHTVTATNAAGSATTTVIISVPF